LDSFSHIPIHTVTRSTIAGSHRGLVTELLIYVLPSCTFTLSRQTPLRNDFFQNRQPIHPGWSVEIGASGKAKPVSSFSFNDRIEQKSDQSVEIGASVESDQSVEIGASVESDQSVEIGLWGGVRA